MVDSQLRHSLPIENGAYAFHFFQPRTNFAFERTIIEINMRDLMVRHGEHFAGARIQNFQAQLLSDSQPARFAKRSVNVNWFADVRNPIFRKQNDLDHLLAEKINETADDGVNFAQVANDGRV